MRPLLPFAFIALIGGASVGCSKSKPEPSAEEQAQDAANKLEQDELHDKERINVATTAGTADRRDQAKGVKLYTVSWKTAALTLGRSGIQEGQMNDVNGIVYEEEQPRTTFTAAAGYAKKETQTLFLEGRVVVKNSALNLTLHSQKLEWLPDVKRYRARGEVTLTTPNGTLGPTDELLATSDLKRFGTPDRFDKTPTP